MDTPRVLHVITGLNTGGAENMLASLVGALPAPARPVGVVSLLGAGCYGPMIEAAGVPVLALGMRPGRVSPWRLYRLARAIRRLEPDIVQSWMYHADLAALAALRLSGRRGRTRLIWGVRCSDMDLSQYRRTLRLAIRACARLSAMPDLVVANSRTGRHVHEAYGYHVRRFEVIHNGVDTTRYRPDPAARARARRTLGIADDAVVVCLVARVDAMKDHAGFLHAFAGVTDVQALLVGEGTDELPAAPNVTALGRRDDVPELLAASDIVVSSSAFGEGLSNAIAEGMASGLAAVATDVGDSRELVGSAGLIVPPRAPDQLATAIQTLVDNPDLRREFGARARRRIEEHFALAACVERFQALYCSLLEPAAAAPAQPA